MAGSLIKHTTRDGYTAVACGVLVTEAFSPWLWFFKTKGVTTALAFIIVENAFVNHVTQRRTGFATGNAANEATQYGTGNAAKNDAGWASDNANRCASSSAVGNGSCPGYSAGGRTDSAAGFLA